MCEDAKQQEALMTYNRGLWDFPLGFWEPAGPCSVNRLFIYIITDFDVSGVLLICCQEIFGTGYGRIEYNSLVERFVTCNHWQC